MSGVRISYGAYYIPMGYLFGVFLFVKYALINNYEVLQILHKMRQILQMQQLRKQQPGRASANNSHLRLHINVLPRKSDDRNLAAALRI